MGERQPQKGPNLRDFCGSRGRFFRIFSEFSLLFGRKGSETGTLATASTTTIPIRRSSRRFAVVLDHRTKSISSGRRDSRMLFWHPREVLVFFDRNTTQNGTIPSCPCRSCGYSLYPSFSMTFLWPFTVPLSSHSREAANIKTWFFSHIALWEEQARSTNTLPPPMSA